VWLESEAMSVLMQEVQAGRIEWVGSTVLEMENSENPWQFRRDATSAWFRFVTRRQSVTVDVERRTLELESAGLKSIDAAHLACAEAGGATEFVTCDDRISRRYGGPLKLCTPIECITLLEKDDDDDKSTQ
jgi:predicted nucleic acid-binding protein